MSQGRLYIVSTPIGNLEDFSHRAERVLREVDLVAAEDTRHSRKLLDHYGIQTPMQAVHEHNENQLASHLVADMRAGKSIALISDAGTPLISDPGFILAREARRAGVGVIAIPGASAVLAALAVSGLPTDRFMFEGFLPAKSEARRKRLLELKSEPRTLVLYESSHRIKACVADLAELYGPDRLVCLCRELTKMHETSVTMPARELPGWLMEDANRQRGEFVLVIGGAAESDVTSGDSEVLLRLLLDELPPSTASRLVAKMTGQSRNELYALAMKLHPED